MQELTVPPQMTSPYTPAGGSHMPSAPMLGAPIPGMTGGLPAKPGLSVTQNPMAPQLQSQAQQLQQHGRGEDSVLVHMTPNEVNSLRGLAQRFGGDLTTNPHTGLPEAGWLGKLLPTILGVVGAAFGLPTWALALGVGAGQTALTGDIKKGLMAGLGAYGGASLAGGLGLGKAGEAALRAVPAGTDAATQVGEMAAEQATNAGAAGAAGAAAGAPSAAFTQAFSPQFMGGLTNAAGAGLGATTAAAGAGAQAAANAPGILSKFGTAARSALPAGTPAIISKAAPYLAGYGLMNSISEASAPNLPRYKPEESKWNYKGPYVPGRREVSFEGIGYDPNNFDSSERSFFTPSNPVPGFRPYSELTEQERAVYGFASGGAASLPTSNMDDLIAYFGSTSPGAITASMYPTKPATSTTTGSTTTGSTTTPTTTGSTGGAGKAETDYGFSKSASDPATSAWKNAVGGLGGIGGPFGLPANLQAVIADYFATHPGAVPTTVPTGPTNPAKPTVTPSKVPGGESLYTFGNAMMPNDISVIPNAEERGRGSNRRPSSGSRNYSTSGGGRGERNPTKEYANGGRVNMRDGSFVMDARTVSELGNGSSNAGMEMLSRLGGRPVHGPGDGVSDSIPARIGGRQEARVARDEVIFPPEAVRRMGNGSEKRGTQKLYALMDKAHKARKRAGRGTDTQLRRGLA